jgi:hypothetical protein
MRKLKTNLTIVEYGETNHTQIQIIITSKSAQLLMLFPIAKPRYTEQYNQFGDGLSIIIWLELLTRAKKLKALQ